jgi:hypothetical protein
MLSGLEFNVHLQLSGYVETVAYGSDTSRLLGYGNKAWNKLQVGQIQTAALKSQLTIQ